MKFQSTIFLFFSKDFQSIIGFNLFNTHHPYNSELFGFSFYSSNSRNAKKADIHRYCVGKEMIPLPQSIEGFREDSDNSWKTPATSVSTWKTEKFAIRPELITFDFFQTLAEPSQSIGRWYREALNTVCEMKIRLPRPALFTASFEIAYSEM
jgi:hypothetical protein